MATDVSLSPWSAEFVPGVMGTNGTWEVYNYVGDVNAPTLFSGSFAECEAFIAGLGFAKKDGWER